MITLAFFGGGEFILVLLWIIVLVFAFDIECVTEPIDGRPWLLTGAFSHIVFDVAGGVFAGVFAMYNGSEYFARLF